MQRYFVSQKANDATFFIGEEDRHHIVKVMRMQVGDQIICVDPGVNRPFAGFQKLPIQVSLQTLYNG